MLCIVSCKKGVGINTGIDLAPLGRNAVCQRYHRRQKTGHDLPNDLNVTMSLPMAQRDHVPGLSREEATLSGRRSQSRMLPVSGLLLPTQIVGRRREAAPIWRMYRSEGETRRRDNHVSSKKWKSRCLRSRPLPVSFAAPYVDPTDRRQEIPRVRRAL